MHRFNLVLPVVAVGAIIAAVTWAASAWNASRVPESFNVMDFGAVDLGGGPPVGHGHHHGASVVAFRERETGPPDVRLELVARHAELRLPSGKRVRALTFNGTVPGPEIRVELGQLVEITLENEDVEEGVSVHWHGLDVPNAEDGVAGITQDAVPVGGRHVYRFRTSQAGTYWYHSHQHSLDEVERGLYGAFVVEPADGAARGEDLTLIAHRLPGATLLGASDEVVRRTVAAGTSVRLRLVNSDNLPRRFGLAGTPYRVAAIDGGELHRPAPLRDETLLLAAGGRYDVEFTMPAGAVTVAVRSQRTGLVLSPDGTGELAEPAFGAEFDPAAYGTAAAGVRPGERFDRSFTVEMGRKLGFHAGSFRLGRQWTINGKTFPHMPVLAVARGDLVKISFVNESGADHPMHLHGHHMLVIGRDGQAVQTPWLVDTLNVEPGERYDVAVRADNPGLWMFHCHNLEHAARGFMTHLVYGGVFTPYRIGDETPNTPE